MPLTNISELEAFKQAIEKCKGDVWLESIYGDRFNLKSTLSQYMAIARLCEDHGDEYEIFCMNKSDEAYMIEFFHVLKG